MQDYADWCRAIVRAVGIDHEFPCPICGERLMIAKPERRWMRDAVYNTRYHRMTVHLAEAKHSPQSVEDAAMAAMLGMDDR